MAAEAPTDRQHDSDEAPPCRALASVTERSERTEREPDPNKRTKKRNAEAGKRRKFPLKAKGLGLSQDSCCPAERL